MTQPQSGEYQRITVAEFAAWCRTKPANERYEYTSSTACPIAQFLRETGRGGSARCIPSVWYNGITSREHELNSAVDELIRPVDVYGNRIGRTFGQLVERLEATEEEYVDLN